MKRRLTQTLIAAFAFAITAAPAAFSIDTVLASFSVSGAESAVVSPDGRFVWVHNCNNSRVEKWSTETPTLQTSVTVSGCGYNLAMTPDGSKIVAASALGNKIDIISTSSATLVASLSTSVNPRGVAISPDGSVAWVGLTDGKIVKVSLTSNTITSTTAITGATGIFDIAPTADGSTLYLCTQNNSLMKVQTSNLSVSSSATLFQPCWFVALAPNETYAYTSYYYPSARFERVNLSTMTVSATITGMNSTAQGQFSKDGNYFYISNSGAGTLLKVRTSDNTVVSTISNLGSPVWHVAISPLGENLFAMNSGGTVYKIGADGAIAASVATISLSPFSVATFRTSTTLQATVGTSGGRATFYQNGKYIPGCQSIIASTTTVSCSYKPSFHGAVQISVKYVLNSSSATITGTLPVQVRKTLR